MYLRYMKSAPACEALIQMLSDKDERLVESTILSLGELQCEEAVAPLLELLLEADPEKFFHIIGALSQIGGPEAKAALTKLFDNAEPDTVLKTEAAVALAEMGNPTGIPYLREGPIGDTNIAMRLAKAGEYSAVPVLIKLTNGRWPATNYKYGKILEELTGKNYGWDTRKWEKWWEKNKDELLQTMLAGNVHKGGV